MVNLYSSQVVMPLQAHQEVSINKGIYRKPSKMPANNESTQFSKQRMLTSTFMQMPPDAPNSTAKHSVPVQDVAAAECRINMHS